MGCTALVSVGFAAWVITTTPDPVTLNGDIIVETVTDTNISFVQDEFVWTDSDDDPENNQKIIFGGREAEPGDWLVNSTLEHLSTKLTIVVENYTELEKVKVSLAASVQKSIKLPLLQIMLLHYQLLQMFNLLLFLKLMDNQRKGKQIFK